MKTTLKFFELSEVAQKHAIELLFEVEITDVNECTYFEDGEPLL